MHNTNEPTGQPATEPTAAREPQQQPTSASTGARPRTTSHPSAALGAEGGVAGAQGGAAGLDSSMASAILGGMDNDEYWDDLCLHTEDSVAATKAAREAEEAAVEDSAAKATKFWFLFKRH